MRRIADQRHPLGDEGARDEIGKRKRPRLVERLDLAEMQPEPLLELAMKFVFAQGNDARGLGPFLVDTSEERFPVKGRTAKGPAGRKCSSARP